MWQFDLFSKYTIDKEEEMRKRKSEKRRESEREEEKGREEVEEWEGVIGCKDRKDLIIDQLIRE